jgi:excinuclease ABC subunit A
VGTRLLIGFDMPIVAVPDAIPPADLEDGDLVEAAAPAARGKGTAAARRDTALDAVGATIDSLVKRGFRRLLVDGRTVNVEEADRAALARGTQLKVIIDRLVVEGDLRARLTDSVETAYREGGGAAFAVELPRDESAAAATQVFSERFECRRCGIQYEDPQPRLFSFNNPFGACATCHGFGNVIELDMELVVPDATKSIRQGAIEPWSKPHYRRTSPSSSARRAASRSRSTRRGRTSPSRNARA